MFHTDSARFLLIIARQPTNQNVNKIKIQPFWAFGLFRQRWKIIKRVKFLWFFAREKADCWINIKLFYKFCNQLKLDFCQESFFQVLRKLTFSNLVTPNLIYDYSVKFYCSEVFNCYLPTFSKLRIIFWGGFWCCSSFLCKFNNFFHISR